jgi:uncharacterized repeat protein (TIGR03843 family)
MVDPILIALREGEVILKGEFVWGSNYTFLVTVQHTEQTVAAVYKPTRGERPLWDFPQASLARREAAAYLVSEAIGWGIVPPTVYRRQAPLGPGSLQQFIEHDPQYHYFSFSDEDRQRLRPAALFDLLINNADRKGSHVLVDADHHIWLIDHGVCFHVEDKLRTVIWDFAGQPIPEELCAALKSFRQSLSAPSDLIASLEPLLNRGERRALARRAERLLAERRYPDPPPDRRAYPWPPV